ncbi:hypothetical protein GFB56_09925, partial [Ensifer sp. T173]
MSAVQIFLSGDRAHIVTDGATEPRGLTVKAIPIPHLGIVIAMRGTSGGSSRIQWLASRFPSVERLRRELPTQLRNSFGLLHKFGLELGKFDLYVAGVEHGKAFAFFISSQAHRESTPFEINEITSVSIAPDNGDEAIERALEGWYLDTRGKTDRLGGRDCRDGSAKKASGDRGGSVCAANNCQP